MRTVDAMKTAPPQAHLRIGRGLASATEPSGHAVRAPEASPPDRIDAVRLPGQVLERILISAQAMAHADGATIYRVVGGGSHLRFEIVRSDSLGIAYGGTFGKPMPPTFRDLPLFDREGRPNHSMVATYAALCGRVVNIADAYAAEGFDFSGTRRFDEATGYRSTSFLAAPIKDGRNRVVAVLQLLNAIDPKSGAVVPFSGSAQRAVEALIEPTAISLSPSLLNAWLKGSRG